MSRTLARARRREPRRRAPARAPLRRGGRRGADPRRGRPRPRRAHRAAGGVRCAPPGRRLRDRVAAGATSAWARSADVMRALQSSRVLAARYTNPLTLLPGQVPINEHLERLLAQPVAVQRVVRRGRPDARAERLRGLREGRRADPLDRAAAGGACASPGVDFVGHISGSRFVMLMQSEDWRARAERALARFPARRARARARPRSPSAATSPRRRATAARTCARCRSSRSASCRCCRASSRRATRWSRCAKHAAQHAHGAAGKRHLRGRAARQRLPAVGALRARRVLAPPPDLPAFLAREDRDRVGHRPRPRCARRRRASSASSSSCGVQREGRAALARVEVEEAGEHGRPGATSSAMRRPSRATCAAAARTGRRARRRARRAPRRSARRSPPGARGPANGPSTARAAASAAGLKSMPQRRPSRSRRGSARRSALPHPGTSTRRGRGSTRDELAQLRRHPARVPGREARAVAQVPEFGARRDRAWETRRATPNGSAERLYFGALPHDEYLRISRLRRRAVLAACSAPAPKPRAPTLALADCRLPGVDIDGALRHARGVGGPRGAGRAGASRSTSRSCPRSCARRSPIPIVVLAGGPGQGAIALAPQVMPLFARLNDTRDIVFIDQRGTGGSNPLDCDEDEPQPLQTTLRGRAARAAGGRVPDAQLDADPRQYVTTIAMADLEEVRAGAGLRQAEPLGRLVRHARRARVRAPPPRPRAHRDARRRGARRR